MENDNDVQITQMDLKRFSYFDKTNNINLSFDLSLHQVPAFRELLMRAYVDLGIFVNKTNIQKDERRTDQGK